jgi:UDP-GlcNAc:undecaprenyl-phosphate GlcNAc-1-phosphate transferase
MITLAFSLPPGLVRTYLLPLGISLVVTLAMTPVARNLAIRLGIFDRPDAGLKPHEKPIPYLGGVAMYLGWMAAIAWGLYCLPVARWQLTWIAIAGTLLMVTGLIDDMRHLHPKHRLLIQAIVAGGLIYGGVGSNLALIVLEPLREYLPAVCLSEGFVLFASGAICVGILAGACNASNLIDGLDGLCAGIIGIASLGFYLLSFFIRGFGEQQAGIDPLRLVLCAALLGACLGFLRYNFNPASIFMGDSGSLLLGFNCAVLMILLAGKASPRWIIGALGIFAFPIFDTALAITRRWLNGKPLFIGDRSHFYDQLRDRGMSVRQTVLFCYLIALASAGVANLVVHLPKWQFTAIVIAAPILIWFASRRLGLLRVDRSSTQP